MAGDLQCNNHILAADLAFVSELPILVSAMILPALVAFV